MSEEPAACDAGGKTDPWAEPRWLEAHESPFGVRVYDCRRLTLVGTIWTARQEDAQNWIKLVNGDGSEFRGVAIPDALHIPCELLYPTPAERQEGRYNRPRQMEEIWCVDFYDGCFQFIQSLDSRLAYRAHVRSTGPESLKITHVEVHPEKAKHGSEHVLDAVDYLMKSHLFHWVAPHPFPPHLRERPESDLSGYSFFEYGRRALFGTFETTRTLGGFPWDPEKIVYHGLAEAG
jgi:hypothetical protein